MYVEYDSVRDFFFLAPPAFLGLSPTSWRGLGHFVFVFFPMCWNGGQPAGAHTFRAWASR